jgi:hypothetical protein
MPIYAENEGTVDVGPVADAEGTVIEGATVTVTLLRGTEELWSGEGTTDEDGYASVTVPHPLLDDAEEEVPLTVGEILTERVEIASGSVDAQYENERRVRKRRS